MEIIRKLWPYLKPQIKIQIMAFLCICIGTLASLYQPILLKKCVDLYSEGNLNIRRVVILFIFLLLLLVIQVLSGLIRDYLIVKIRNLIKFKLRNKVYERGIRTFCPVKVGKIVSMIYDDVDAVTTLLNSAMMSIASDCLILLLTAVLLFVLDWRLALMSIAFMPLYYLIYVLFRKRIYQLNRLYKHQLDQMTDTLQRGIRQRGLSTRFNRQKHSILTFLREQRPLIKLDSQLSWYGSLLSHGSIFITSLLPLALLLGGGVLLMHHQITLGTLVAFSSYVGKLFQPISRLTQVNVGIQSAVVSAKRIIEFIQQEDEWKYGDIYNGLQDRIEFRNVSFEYEPACKIFNNLTFTIEKNEMIAVVGESGSGKSTLLRLLTGQLVPTTGSITYNNQEVRKWDRVSFYKKIAVVNQEEEIITGTIYENIAYGRKGTTQEEIINAARKVGLHQTIESLPNGYHTMVQSGDFELSVGQKQRLVVARAIIRNADVLIFDEITSALDADSETIIIELLRELKDNFTIILIAHRFQSIIHADHILVLDKNGLLEYGTHEQLLEQNKVYARLYKQQCKNLLLNEA